MELPPLGGENERVPPLGGVKDGLPPAGGVKERVLPAGGVNDLALPLGGEKVPGLSEGGANVREPAPELRGLKPPGLDVARRAFSIAPCTLLFCIPSVVPGMFPDRVDLGISVLFGLPNPLELFLLPPFLLGKLPSNCERSRFGRPVCERSN